MDGMMIGIILMVAFLGFMFMMCCCCVALIVAYVMLSNPEGDSTTDTTTSTAESGDPILTKLNGAVAKLRDVVAWTTASGIYVAASGIVKDLSDDNLEWYTQTNGIAWNDGAPWGAYYKFKCVQDKKESDFSIEYGPVQFDALSACPTLRLGTDEQNPCIAAGGTLKVFRKFGDAGTYAEISGTDAEGNDFTGAEAYFRDDKDCTDMEQMTVDLSGTPFFWAGKTSDPSGLTWDSTDRETAWDMVYQFRCKKNSVVTAWLPTAGIGPLTKDRRWCPQIRVAPLGSKNACGKAGGKLQMQRKSSTASAYTSTNPRASNGKDPYNGEDEVLTDNVNCST